MRHPREQRISTRRGFLGQAGGVALGLSGIGAAASACANSTSASSAPSGGLTGPGPGGLPLARPDRRVTLPLYAGNPAITSGTAPERGATLQVYNWAAYMNQAVIADFEKAYDCKVAVTTFATIDEGLAKISARTTQFDVFFPTIDLIEELVVGKLIQPLNHSYLPNLAANIWPTLQSPYYDVDARYTVPYTIWTTGIAWRNDKLPNFRPNSMQNPYDIFWQSTGIAGRVGMLDDERDCMGMVLLRNGITDVNTEKSADLGLVQNQLLQLVQTTACRFDTLDYTDLPNGLTWVHQGWSGDIIGVPLYMPKGLSPDVISYWWPKNGRGLIGNDAIAVVEGAKSPVLAHLFLNHILDYKQSLLNMRFTGYQQPQIRQNPDQLVAEGLVRPAQKSCIAYESEFRNGYQAATLSVNGARLWENAWAAVKSS